MSDISLKALIATVIQIDPTSLTDASGMNETDGWDSLKQFEIMADIENQYSVKLKFDDIEHATTIGAIRAALKRVGVVAAE
jgi:acyl carrier protein